MPFQFKKQQAEGWLVRAEASGSKKTGSKGTMKVIVPEKGQGPESGYGELP